MKKKILLTVMMLTMIIASAIGQTISGVITDTATGERVAYAVVFVRSGSASVTSNAYGYYSMSGVSSADTLGVYAIGYAVKYVPASSAGGGKLDIDIRSLHREIAEVEVKSESAMRREVFLPRMSRHHLTAADVSSTAVMFGEADALKALQFMPGVNAAADGSVNMSVRGGSYDQNLILLDEATVYNPSHAMGIFSAFNPDAVSSVDFYKGGIPARYGGRLSAVTDIHMLEGNTKRTSVEGSVGTIASRALVGGPLAGSRATYMIAGRYGYGDLSNLVADFFDRENAHKNDNIRFYDVCAKVSWNVDEENKVYASGYTSHDDFRCDVLSQDNNQKWGNKTATLRWNHIFGDNVFANYTVLYSDYDYSQRQEEDVRNFEWQAAMREVNVKADYDHYLDKMHITYGGVYEHHWYNPGQIVPLNDSSAMLPVYLDKKRMDVLAAYAEDEHKITDRFSATAGLRMTAAIAGRVHWGAEPRVSAAFRLNDAMAVKASYMHTVQFQHMLSNSALGLPTDMWMPASKRVEPQMSNTFAVGLHGAKGRFEYSLETYGRRMHSIIDFKDHAQIEMNNDIEDEILKGTGRGCGLETMVRYDADRFSATVAYTLSKAERQIDGVNGGDWYYAVYDQRNNLSANLTSYVGQRRQWTLSAAFRYHTGGRTTLPYAVYVYNGVSLQQYTERNGYVMPEYHRLDISAAYDFEKKRDNRWHSQIVFSLYNCYGRKNAYSMFMKQMDYRMDLYQGYIMYLYQWVPSVTYNFKF